MTRGRVIAVDGELLVVRTERENVVIAAGDLGAAPGDLVDDGRVVRRIVRLMS